MKVTADQGRNVQIELDGSEAELLGIMLTTDVIGDAGHGGVGIVGALNQGADNEDEYQPTHYTMIQALQFARDILAGLPRTTMVEEGLDMADTWLRDSIQ